MFFYYMGYVVGFVVCVYIGMLIANIIRLSFKNDKEVVDLYENATLKLLIKLKRDVDRVELMCDNIIKKNKSIGEINEVDRIYKVYKETEEIKRHILQSYLYISNKKLDELDKE